MEIYKFDGREWSRYEIIQNALSVTISENNYIVSLSEEDYSGNIAKVYDRSIYKIVLSI